MSKEPPELIANGDLLFKIGVACIFIIIIYFMYNLFSKMKEINNKLDSFLIDTVKPVEITDLQKDAIEDISEKDKESNVDLSGVDLSQDLDTIKE
mgnify:FL=1|tara:strand:- start:1020 stop:1304 length:285 start_codon:yes stop_codon:yes gene_type:complete